MMANPICAAATAHLMVSVDVSLFVASTQDICMGCYEREPQLANSRAGNSGTLDKISEGLKWMRGLHLANYMHEED